MWFGFLSANLPDMEKSNVFICPSWVTRARINADPMPEPWRTMSIYACSYGTNGAAKWNIDPSGRGFSFRGTLVPKPSQNIYATERMGIDQDGSLWPDPNVDPPTAGALYKIDSPGPNTAINYSYNIRLSHRSRCNALFYDGHVEAVTGDQLLANPSPWWNP